MTCELLAEVVVRVRLMIARQSPITKYWLVGANSPCVAKPFSPVQSMQQSGIYDFPDNLQCLVNRKGDHRSNVAPRSDIHVPRSK
jgi:hypothetical protein